jgi:hypothetical protein
LSCQQPQPSSVNLLFGRGHAQSVMRPDFVCQLSLGIVFIVRFSKRVPNPSGPDSKVINIQLEIKSIKAMSFVSKDTAI